MSNGTKLSRLRRVYGDGLRELEGKAGHFCPPPYFAIAHFSRLRRINRNVFSRSETVLRAHSQITSTF